MTDRDESHPILAVDDKSANYTSDPIDMRLWEHMRVITIDEGSFAGTVVVKALLAGVDDDGAETESGSTYMQYGAALTLDRVEKFEHIPALIVIDVTRTAGAVSVWVQGYNS